METSMETGSELPRPSIGEPHFEEDWTVQEARPVIPLENIKAAKHRKFAFRLVGAFAVAVILGAVTALVSIGLKQAPVQSTDDSVAIADEKPEVAATDKASKVEREVPELDDQPVAEEEKPVAVSEQKSVARPVKPVRQVKTRSEPAAEANLDNRMEPRPILVDQWQERRARRVLRRERKERRAQRNRDLIRIDELFEGQRPN